MNGIEEEAREVLKWIEGVEDGVPRSSFNNMPEEGELWYIVSMKWLDKWKQFMGLKERAGEVEMTPVDNSDLLEENPKHLTTQAEKVLREGLEIGSDYEILPPKAWKYFKEKFGVLGDCEIKRKSIAINDLETQVEVNLKPIQVGFCLKEHKIEEGTAKVMFVSHKASVRDTSTKIRRIMREKLGKEISQQHIRLWKLNTTYSLEDLKKTVKTSNVVFPGSLLYESSSLEEAEVADSDILVAELKSDFSPWTFIQKSSKRCENCWKREMANSITCDCGKNDYCSTKCMRQDSKYHSCGKSVLSYSNNNRSPYLTREAAPTFYERTPSSRMGLCGLQNLGNTCYMNSGLQCLSNTYELTEHFLSGAFKEEINTDNALGTGGQLVSAYAQLINEMWYGTSEFLSPWKFKRALGTFARQFSGYQQHDSQEAISFLLDFIHEDLNRVKKKPYIEELKTEGMTEEQMANVFWEAHIARNQSIIVDLMYGQYRSELTCPNCQGVSLAFDPFMMLTLPIPTKQQTSIEVTFVPADLLNSPVKLKLLVNRNYTAEDIKAQISEMFEVSNDKLELVSVVNYSFEPLKTTENNYNLYAYEVPDLGPNETVVILEQAKESAYFSISQKSGVAQPRLVKVSESQTLQELYFTVFSSLMAIVCPEDLDKVQEKFRENFPSIFGNSNDQLFTLNFVNPNRRKGYSSYYYKPTSPCMLCEKSSCTNCSVPYTEELLGSYFEKCKQLNKNLKLEIVWPKETQKALLSKLSKVEEHESVKRIDKLLAEQKGAKVTLYDCLEYFSSPEQLDEKNTTFCPKCKDHVRGTKKMDIYKLPKVLIIHLKRFKQSGYYSSRNNKVVEFPIEGLEMDRFTLAGGGVYDLCGVTNHYGSMSFGHYTAYVWSPHKEKWFYFDDSNVSPVRETSQIVSQASYVLFYKRRN